MSITLRQTACTGLACGRGKEKCRARRGLSNAHDLGLQLPAGDVDLPVLVDVHIDLATDAEFRQVDARLDGEARSPHDPPVVAGLQAVDVGAVAVHFLADVVPGAVDELVPVPGLVDHGPGSVIDLGTG